MEKKSLKMVKRQKSELKKVYMPVNKKEDNVAAIMSSSQSSRYDPVVNSLEGMHAPELTLVRHLAATDDITRRKAIRKLRKWLNILAAKVPDSPDSRKLIESNLIRVWKALFYCIWIADEPLIQQQLVESISVMQNIFSSKTTPYLLFVEWFIRTLVSEWRLIDGFRIDGFIMLFRIFIRNTLQVIASKKWKNVILEGFLKIISTHVFNRNFYGRSKTLTNSLTLNTPIGLQIPFVDFFMEEFAKVAGDSIKFQKTLKFLTVFMNELGYSNEDRLLGEIQERIFHHLIRQSKVEPHHPENMVFGLMLKKRKDHDVYENDDEDHEDDNCLEAEAENKSGNLGVLDLPGGDKNVKLPHIYIDNEILHQKLGEFGRKKEIKLKNRRILYSLASQFKKLPQGNYPLVLSQDDDKKPVKLKNEGNLELTEIEKLESVGHNSKLNKPKKRSVMKALELNMIDDSEGSEDNSEYILDEELLEHVNDNYISYLYEEINKISCSDAVGDEINQLVTMVTESATPALKEKKAEKIRLSKESKRKKRKVELEVEFGTTNVLEAVANVEDAISEKGPANDIQCTNEVFVLKRPKSNERAPVGGYPYENTPRRGIASLLSELYTPKNENSKPNNRMTNSASKQVNFVLAKNEEHDQADYSISIALSPALPYDKKKQPNTKGLLKAPGHNSMPASIGRILDFSEK